jgi:alpha-L-arabinofuranosidase
MPEYYGLYMATQLGSGKFLPVTVTSDHNVTAYAVRGDDGHLRIAVIEKDDTSGAPVPVSINVGGRTGSASVIHLTGQSLDSAAGVAIQGSAVDRKGHLNPGRADRVRVHQGTVDLTVASGSAVVLTLDGC